MGFFSRKPQVSIEDFCRDFYDSQIFHPIIGGTDVGSVFWAQLHKAVTDVDKTFAVIGQASFQLEMMGIRLELFSLAWAHQLKKDEYTLPQTVFTKHYLEHISEQGFWDVPLPYNQAVAQSSADVVTGERASRATVTYQNEFRFGVMDKWVASGVDPECAARVLNRYFTDVAWAKGLARKMIVGTLLERLDCQVNHEGRFKLEAAVQGLYNGAKTAIKSVKIVA